MVAVILLLGTDTHRTLRERTERSLADLARDVEWNLQHEFDDLQAQLESYDQQLAAAYEPGMFANDHLVQARDLLSLRRLQPAEIVLGIPNGLIEGGYVRSDFEVAFWVRPCDGLQFAKGTIRNENSGQLRVDFRDYYRAVQEGKLWQRSAAPENAAIGESAAAAQAARTSSGGPRFCPQHRAAPAHPRRLAPPIGLAGNRRLAGPRARCDAGARRDVRRRPLARDSPRGAREDRREGRRPLSRTVECVFRRREARADPALPGECRQSEADACGAPIAAARLRVPRPRAAADESELRLVRQPRPTAGGSSRVGAASERPALGAHALGVARRARRDLAVLVGHAARRVQHRDRVAFRCGVGNPRPAQGAGGAHEARYAHRQVAVAGPGPVAAEAVVHSPALVGQAQRDAARAGAVSARTSSVTSAKSSSFSTMPNTCSAAAPGSTSDAQSVHFSWSSARVKGRSGPPR